MQYSLSLRLQLVALVLLSGAKAIQAQTTDFGLIDGSIVFVDEQSDARCAAVNTFNADFFIRSCDRRLILISGDDRETPYTVNDEYVVFHEDGTQVGYIRFATDNDGLRQVFWLSDEQFEAGENLVLQYSAEEDAVSVATVAGQEGNEIALQPINVSDTQCDPLATFDGGDELLCPRTLPAVLCGTGTMSAMVIMTCLLWGWAGMRRNRH